MFIKNNRYITRGINKELDLRLQLILWNIIDSLKEEGKDLDYLQVFKLRKYEEKIIIEHNQEVPKYKENYVLDLNDIEINKIIKVFVIDSEDYSTMMLAEEY
ncbi:DUF960 family protein [Clostridium sp. B9]|uniref:DUF960 family protein n=1 Tax=Clostridium sp. B9 TaxID=3423224 RepID=UPI003D2ECA7F